MSNNKQNLGTLKIVTHKIENVEWVFQFNDDKPIHIVGPSTDRGSKELTFTIGNTINSNVVFSDGKGNTFKIFAREKGGNNDQQ
jgi:hypothetical protein